MQEVSRRATWSYALEESSCSGMGEARLPLGVCPSSLEYRQNQQLAFAGMVNEGMPLAYL